MADEIDHICGEDLIWTDLNIFEQTLWRGMVAGSQAQGSWQNNKGSAAEIIIRELSLRRLQERNIITGDKASNSRIKLDEQRTLVFADNPTLPFIRMMWPWSAIEIKGVIDAIVEDEHVWTHLWQMIGL